MDWDRHKGWTLLLLRLAVVLIFLWHAVPKAFTPEVGVQKFVDMGFPGFLGPIVGWAEVVAAALVVLGVWFPWANLALAGIIAVALVAVQLPKGFVAGFERDLLLLAATLTLAAHGPGRWALGSKVR